MAKIQIQIPRTPDRQARTAQHHLEQFGLKTPAELMLKMTEEFGELARAVVRDEERRDGRRWMTEIYEEFADVVTGLYVLAHKYGFSFDDVVEYAHRKFMERKWPNIRKKREE